MSLESKPVSILIIDPDESSRLLLEEALRLANLDVSSTAAPEDGLRSIHSNGTALVILSGDYSEALWSNTLAKIKGSEHTSQTRVILMTRGSAPERAKALDLGADDAMTLPWEPAEFLARVRAQLRDRRAHEDLEEKTRISEEGRQIAQTAFQALAVTEKMTRDAFSLGRALKIGVAALFTVAVLIAGIFLLYSRRAEKETRLAYSIIAQFERSVHTEQALLAETRKQREELEQLDAESQKRQLQAQSENLREKISGASASEVSGLRKQLDETTSRLKKIESESGAAEAVVRADAPSVCLLHVSVSFLDQSSRRPLRYVAITPEGEPLKDSTGAVSYTLEGRAPEVRADFFGTGFIVGENRILTNHHVAQPWWNDEDLKVAARQGLQPAIAEMTAYFPEAMAGIPANISQISDEADLALIQADLSSLKLPVLQSDGRKEAAVSGQPLISLGYATGLSAILARANEDTVKEILKTSGGDAKEVVDQLQKRKLIRPLVTQGHIGDVLPDKIVYDAQMALGGSGGPLINRGGKVIGVTFAVVKGFGGSNLGVPIRFAQPLLKP